MDIKKLIVQIIDFLSSTFVSLDSWFDKDISIRQYKLKTVAGQLTKS